MSVDFWSIVGSSSIASRHDVESALAAVRSRVSGLDLVDLVEFQRLFKGVLSQLDKHELASIPVVMADGQTFEQTIDHFLYARCACILSGENAVREALENGPSFARFVAPRLQSAELLLYVASDEYESRTGRSIHQSVEE